MKINSYQPSFMGLRVNRNEVVEKCKSDKRIQNEINGTFANFIPRATSVWAANGMVGLFFKDKEQEGTVTKLFDKFDIDYEQSGKIDQYDGFVKQDWVETGSLPE